VYLNGTFQCDPSWSIGSCRIISVYGVKGWSSNATADFKFDKTHYFQVDGFTNSDGQKPATGCQYTKNENGTAEYDAHFLSDSAVDIYVSNLNIGNGLWRSIGFNEACKLSQVNKMH
jgi:hypothetical protein